MTRHSFKNTAAGALMGVAAIFAPIAATAQDANNPPAKTMTSDDYPAATHDEAKAASVGQIVLHFGEGFPEMAVRTLVRLLNENGYARVTAFSAGPQNELTLCMKGKCLNKNFDFETSDLLLGIVNEYGADLREQIAPLPENNNS